MSNGPRTLGRMPGAIRSESSSPGLAGAPAVVVVVAMNPSLRVSGSAGASLKWAEHHLLSRFVSTFVSRRAASVKAGIRAGRPNLLRPVDGPEPWRLWWSRFRRVEWAQQARAGVADG